jgi:hypothetical protein
MTARGPREGMGMRVGRMITLSNVHWQLPIILLLCTYSTKEMLHLKVLNIPRNVIGHHDWRDMGFDSL